MSDFTHLHVHSHYSLLDGLGKIGPLVDRTKELGMDSLAVTDHGSMYGVIELYQTATAAGVKPIIGCEMYMAPRGRKNRRGKIDSNPRHLTVLAQNFQGYKNLLKLTTTAHLEGYYYKPRIDYPALEQHSEGLIVLSGCLNSDISKAIVEGRRQDAENLIKWHSLVFGKNRFFLEVQDHPSLSEQKIVNEALINYARKYNLKLVATADTHYINSHDAEAHDVLVCVQTGKKVSDANRLNMTSDDFSLKSPEELKEIWKAHPDAIDNTQLVAESCNLEIEFGVNRLPRYPLPPGETPEDHLRKLCEKGMKERYAELPEDARERLDYELDVIKKTGFSAYFLIVSDFVKEAKKRGILVGPGRGSAAGSLVSYVMNITNIDPLAYNLLFERFLNPERISMPDIDLDFADDRRDEVIDYVREKYGHEHVAQIITFGTMAARAAVRDAGRVLDMPYSFCDQVAKTIPMMTNFDDALETAELKELYASNPEAKKLIDMARHLEGVCRHASTHAAGVVITDEPLTEYVPLQRPRVEGGSKGQEEGNETVTQFNMKDVEALGLLKVDFLGLKNLTIIKNALTQIKYRHGVEIDIDELPLGDEKAYKLLQEGKTTGVFQLESSGMKRYLKELKPTELEDIISMVALYRPGPMDSIPDFIAAKHGRKRITYLHPILEPILEKTYGVIVTQDQVLQIAREFSGFSYAEADILRKAVGKKIKKLLDEQRAKFVGGAVKNKGIDQRTAEQVWDFIEPFARYGFNRAHAACYAMIAYQTAYLKANYPAEFMAALLTSDEGNTDRAAIEVAEAISMGMAILPPDINESYEDFTVIDNDTIRFGLSAIKNVGHGVVKALIKERKKRGAFKDLSDVFARVVSKDFNRKAVESLAKAGAFDCIAERNQVLENTENLLNFNRALHKEQDTGQRGLFGAKAATPRVTIQESIPAPKDQRLKWEKELLGMFVSEHPLAEHQEAIQENTVPLHELQKVPNESKVWVAGVVSGIKKIITRSQQPMLFVVLEDMSHNTELVVFPSVLEKTQDYWQDGEGLIVEGKVNDKDGSKKVLVENVQNLTKETLAALPRRKQRRKKDQPEACEIVLTRSMNQVQMAQIKEILEANKAEKGLPVVFVVSHNGVPTTMSTQYQMERDNEAALASLRQIVGQRGVRV